MEICGRYRAKIGSAPIWHERFGLIWLDIAAKKIITYDPATNEEKVYDALGWLQALIPTTDEQFIGVYKDGLFYLNFKLGTKKPFATPSAISNIYHLNNGKCSPNGEIWVGTSDSFYKKFKETPQTAFSSYPFSHCKLFSITAEGDMYTRLENISLSTGVEWNREFNKIYHIDAPRHSIFQYELLENGQLQSGEIVYTFQMEEGFPCSLAIDTRGYLYTTLFKGAYVASRSKGQTKVVCLDPASGKIIDEIIIPVSHATACVIGGENLSTLFITTSYGPLPESQIKQEPFAGYLLKIELEHKGYPAYKFNPLKIESLS